jgi:hypothetical protein
MFLLSPSFHSSTENIQATLTYSFYTKIASYSSQLQSAFRPVAVDIKNGVWSIQVGQYTDDDDKLREIFQTEVRLALPTAKTGD